MSIYCDCEKCGCSIQEGDQCYSLMFSRVLVGHDQVVRTLVAGDIAEWCLDCGLSAVQELVKRAKADQVI